MKKRLLLLLVLTGVMIVVSSSVFAETHINPYVWSGSGFNSDNTVYYTYVIKRYNSNYTVDINITNQSSDESAVFNTSYVKFGFVNYVTSSTSKPSDIIVTGGAFVSDYTADVTTTSSGTYVMDFDIDLFLEDAVLKPSESRNYQIVIVIAGNFNTSSLNSYLTIQPTTAESDPSYEATVTANDIATKEESIHQAETQWYHDNQQAIEAVGLENFNFSEGTIGGLQIMQQQFADIWSAIGDLNLIYIFTLTISLATFIIRHFPRTKTTENVTETISESIDLLTGNESARKTITRSRRL